MVGPVNDARSARIVGDGAPVTPTQQSVLIRRQTVTQVSRPPEAAINRQVVWKNTPPPRRATFASHAAQLKTTGDTPVTPLTILQTRGAPRSTVSPGMSHTDGPSRVNESTTTGPTRVVAPINGAPNATTRPVPDVRPNINVRSQPNDEARAVVQPTVRRVPNTQPIVRPVPSTNERPISQITGPSPVNGSPNGSPAHTIAEPITKARATPTTQSAAPPVIRTGTNQPRVIDDRKSPEQGEQPRSTQTAPPKQATDEHVAAERRRVQTENRPKQEETKTPRRG